MAITPPNRPGAAGSDNVIIRKPVSDIYTALSAGALVAVILAIICVWMRAETLFGEFIKF